VGARRRFNGKVVVITGAAGGMGKALSRRFGRAGARLGLLDLDEEAVLHLARELVEAGFDCVGLGLDVTDEEACIHAMDRVAGELGGLDVLINNAGITHRSAFAGTETEVYRKVMAVNFFGSVYCTKAALPNLVKSRGLIVVISSIAGFAPLLGRTGYAASKHALHGFFDSLRTELQGSGVGVTIVCPGFTATGIDRRALDGDGLLTTHPQSKLGRVATPESVAEAVFKAVGRDRRLLVLSAVGRLTLLMTRCCPRLYERVMARSLRSELER
jgi:NAD(P)-dependent dehydrogenase (short-subunit alcohol dehydrogenase family)